MGEGLQANLCYSWMVSLSCSRFTHIFNLFAHFGGSSFLARVGNVFEQAVRLFFVNLTSPQTFDSEDILGSYV